MSADSHLKSVPDPPGAERGGRGGGNNFESRLARLETHLQYLTTKEDLQKLKVWMLIGVIGGMGLAATITLAVIRIFAKVAS